VSAGTGLRRGSVHDKAYAVELRLNALGLYSDASSIVRYADSGANPMQAGTTHLTMFNDTTITSNGTPQGIGLTYAVVSGSSYRVQGAFFGVQGSANATQTFGFTGPTASFTRIFVSFGNSTTNGQNAWTNLNGLGTANAFNWAGASGNGVILYYNGTVTFSAGGTFQPFGMLNSANQFTMKGGTFMDVSPV
jgi:hypothetical protein